MPLYTFKNIETGEVKDIVLSISAMIEMATSGKYVQIIGAPNIVTGAGNPLKNTPSAFKDILKEVKKKSPMATLETD
jgi:hypothetical protein